MHRRWPLLPLLPIVLYGCTSIKDPAGQGTTSSATAPSSASPALTTSDTTTTDPGMTSSGPQPLGEAKCTPLPPRPQLGAAKAAPWLDFPQLSTKQHMALRAQGDVIHVLGSTSPILIHQKDNTICTFQAPNTTGARVYDARFVNQGQELLVSFASHGAASGFVGSYLSQGRQWRPSNQTQAQGSELVALSEPASTLFATLGSGSLHRSDDHGATWSSVFQDENLYTPNQLQLDRSGTLLWSTYIGGPDRVALRWFDTQALPNPESQGGQIEQATEATNPGSLHGFAPDAHRDLTIWLISRKNNVPALGRVIMDPTKRTEPLSVTPVWVAEESTPIDHVMTIWPNPRTQDAVVLGGRGKAPGDAPLAFINAQGSVQYLELSQTQTLTVTSIVEATAPDSGNTVLAVLAGDQNGAKIHLVTATP